MASIISSSSGGSSTKPSVEVATKIFKVVVELSSPAPFLALNASVLVPCGSMSAISHRQSVVVEAVSENPAAMTDVLLAAVP